MRIIRGQLICLGIQSITTVAFHFARERVASNEIEIVYCPTDDMIADVMTKPLSKEKFEKFRLLLGVVDI